MYAQYVHVYICQTSLVNLARSTIGILLTYALTRQPSPPLHLPSPHQTAASCENWLAGWLAGLTSLSHISLPLIFFSFLFFSFHSFIHFFSFPIGVNVPFPPSFSTPSQPTTCSEVTQRRVNFFSLFFSLLFFAFLFFFFRTSW